MQLRTRSSNGQFEIKYYYIILILEVQNTVHLQSLWNKLSAANIPLKVDSPIGRSNIENEF